MITIISFTFGRAFFTLVNASRSKRQRPSYSARRLPGPPFRVIKCMLCIAHEHMSLHTLCLHTHKYVHVYMSCAFCCTVAMSMSLVFSHLRVKNVACMQQHSYAQQAGEREDFFASKHATALIYTVAAHYHCYSTLSFSSLYSLKRCAKR